MRLQPPRGVENVIKIECYDPEAKTRDNASEKPNGGVSRAVIVGEGVSLSDFHAYMPTHSYIFAPSGEMWPASSVNARIPAVPLVDKQGSADVDDKGRKKTLPASVWLDRHRPVEQMTWAPGLPMLIHNRLISDGGWIRRNKVTCFNLYRPPSAELGDPAQAAPWVDQGEKLYGEHFAHIRYWLAHRARKASWRPGPH